MSISKKFIMIFALFVLVPVIVLGAMSLHQLQQSFMKEEHAKQVKAAQMAVTLSELKLSELEKYMYNIYSYKDMFSSLDKLNSGYSITNRHVVSSVLYRFYCNQDIFDSAYIFTDQGYSMYYDVNTYGRYEAYYNEHPQISQNINAMRGGIVWSAPYQAQLRATDTMNSYISCGIQLRDIYGVLQPSGTMVVNINTEIFSRLYGRSEIYPNATLVIMDSDDNIIWSNNAEIVPTKRYEDYFTPMVADDDFWCMKMGDVNTLAVITELKHNGWKYMLVSDHDEVIRQLTAFSSFEILRICLLLPLCFFAAMLIHRMITSPIMRMVSIMNDENTDEGTAQQLACRQDEIGSLYTSFFNMRKRIASLIESIHISTAKEKEYHIKVLQAQINPHFIYNTLDTIFWMARDINAEKISKMIVSLSKIMRYSISKNDDMVTIGQELDCIKNYMFIANHRFNQRYNVEYAIDDELLEYPVFRLLMQPLVENIVKYAFEENDDREYHVWIRGTVENGDALLEIEDNGCGMTQTRVQYVMNNSGDGIGISNINERLMLIYGAEYGMKIHSTPGKGTVIQIRVPPTHKQTRKDDKDAEHSSGR